MKRQGDILLVPVQKLPGDLTEVPRQDGKIILAEGEATGHLHAIHADNAMFLAEDLGSTEGRFLIVKEAETITAAAAAAAAAAGAGVELTHPEHDTVSLEPGLYEVRRQRAYDQAGGIELVAD